MKTIKLDRPPVARERLSDILSAAVVISVLLFGRAALNGPPPAPPTITVITRKPTILIQTTTPAPTWTPAPTQTPEVISITLPTPEPQVVYVAAQPVQAAPTPEPVYQVTSDPPAPAYEPVSAPPIVEQPVRAEDFKVPDPKAKCLFVGCL